MIWWYFVVGILVSIFSLSSSPHPRSVKIELRVKERVGADSNLFLFCSSHPIILFLFVKMVKNKIGLFQYFGLWTNKMRLGTEWKSKKESDHEHKIYPGTQQFSSRVILSPQIFVSFHPYSSKFLSLIRFSVHFQRLDPVNTLLLSQGLAEDHRLPIYRIHSSDGQWKIEVE